MRLLIKGNPVDVEAAKDALAEESPRVWGGPATVEPPKPGEDTKADPVTAGIAIAAIVVSLPAAIEKVLTLLEQRKKKAQAEAQKKSIEALKKKHPNLQITIIELEDEDA
jgi:hypothetical protein